MKKLLQVIAATFMIFALPALAQDASDGEKRLADKEAILKILDRALPNWSEDVLKVPDTKDWTQDLTLSSSVRALGAQELVQTLRKIPNGAEAVKNKAGALRVDPSRGYVRYVNYNLVVDLRNDVGKLPNEEQVIQLGMKVLSRLGMPVEEFARPSVETQMAAGGSVESGKPERVDEIYRLFVVRRLINELPVFGSNAIVAVTDTGEVQRLKTQWPAFRLEPSDRLLGREEVMESAADTLVDQALSEKAELSAQLGYAPIADAPGSAYMPIVLISANDGPTPVLISVPLVAPGDKDER
jgi:hypothetical protein